MCFRVKIIQVSLTFVSKVEGYKSENEWEKRLQGRIHRTLFSS
jgi:hypothetical protein